MRLLIGIKTCHAFRDRADAQRKLWVKTAKGIDIRFFLGGGVAQRDDEVILDCPDDYESLPAKTKAMCRWALENGYTHAFFSDDDCYIRPERLKLAHPNRHDYLGKVRGACNEINPAPYCSGMGYWLSAKAMRIVAESNYTNTTAEDCMVGNVLHEAGITPVHDPRYVIQLSPRNATTSRWGPRRDNDVIASCEFHGLENMMMAHEEFLKDRTPRPVYRHPPDPAFLKVDILLKSFLREGYLFRTTEAIQEHLPGARMVIVDDGDRTTQNKTSTFAELMQQGHAIVHLPFDSGFGAKSNAAIPHYRRKYVLIASDDFDFTPEAAEGVRKLVKVLENSDMDIASGRVNNNPYEGTLEIVGSVCRERRLKYHSPSFAAGQEYHRCDLTVNYSLMRHKILGPDRLHWHDDIKIGGGEHGALFFSALKQGIKTCWVPGVNINEQTYFFQCMDPRYGGYRGRARGEGRPALLREGITKYFCFDNPIPEIC